MISVEEARDRILSALAPLAPEDVPLRRALGRSIAASLTAKRTQPPADLSAMDGYALLAEDAQAATLRVVGTVPAGARFQGNLGPGEAVRIFTGAPLPGGAGAILIQEDATREGEHITLNAAPEPGRHIRRKGSDFAAGETVFAPGHTLSARDMALAAAMDLPVLTCRRRPNVAVLATGDELVPPTGNTPEDGIVNSSAYGLMPLIEAWGGEALDLGIARDDLGDLLGKLDSGREADLILTLGGASVGDHDLVSRALQDEGLTLDFWKIAMRPGKPLLFGHYRRTPLLGLPGNPVSSLVCALLFLRPALARCLGKADPALPVRPARLVGRLSQNGPRADYMRAVLEVRSGERYVQPAPVQDSAMLRLMAESTAFLVRPPHDPPQEDGAMVQVIALEDLAPF